MSEHEHDQQPEQEPTDEQVEQSADPAALRSEAKKRRLQVREVEAERDQLRGRLDERDRDDVERLASERLADPADLWLSTSLDEMRGDDGMIDMGRAEAELDRVLREKPHWRKPEPQKPEPQKFPDVHQGPRRTVEEKKPPSFGQSVKKAIGR